MFEPRWYAGLLRRAGAAVTDRIVWTGEQPADVVAAAYAAAEVFVFPSMTDTQALVLQEAALARVPAVLADPVLHQHGVLRGAGVCSGPDPAAFGVAVVRLLDDPAAARRLGEQAAHRAAEHTPARYAASMLDVYRQATHHHAGRCGHLVNGALATGHVPVL
jgi:1,2-diacylglycerol 3-alpha-glucosyltransferase